jgi:heat shock protein HslJ
MESSTSKVAANVLIVTAILLISVSLVTTLSKKTVVVNPLITQEQVTTTEPVEVVTTPSVATTTVATTSESIITSTSTVTTTTSVKGFTEKKWVWVKTTTSGTTLIPKKATAFTLTFNTDGSLTGTTDCNNFFGSYTLATGTVTFGVLGSTQMACDNSQESDFVISLQGTNHYTIDKNKNLTITTASSSMILK